MCVPTVFLRGYPQNGFRCQCEEAKSHPAVLSDDGHSWVCTKNSRITGSLSDKQKLWLHLTCSTLEGIVEIYFPLLLVTFGIGL